MEQFDKPLHHALARNHLDPELAGLDILYPVLRMKESRNDLEIGLDEPGPIEMGRIQGARRLQLSDPISLF